MATVEVPYRTPHRNLIGLANLLMRKENAQLTVVNIGPAEPNPELFVVTTITWRREGEGQMTNLPRLLSVLETMRGTRGVPNKVYLDTSDGVSLYIPTEKKTSDIPTEPKEAVKFLRDLCTNTLQFVEVTSKEVESTFWKIARKKGFSPEIVTRMEESVQGFDSPSNMYRYRRLMERFFSIRFRVQRAESVLHLEDIE